MKRIALLCIVMTIALTSVCWANEIVGLWEFTGVDVKAESEEDIQTLKGIYGNIERYFTFTEDGRAVNTTVKDKELEYNEGTWIQLTPDHYKFTYTLYSDALKKEIVVDVIISIVDGTIRREQFDSGATYVYEVYEKIKEEE